MTRPLARLPRRLFGRSRYSLEGKVVLVTGGSRGLGLVLSRELASRGARLVLLARHDDELKRAKKDLASAGASVETVLCDVTDRRSVERNIHDIEEVIGPIDVLINNAGIMQVGPLDSMEEDDFEIAYKTHFLAVLRTTLAVLPSMRARREGHIVNICSIGGIISMPHLLPYGASKFALRGLSEGLRAELAKDRIRVLTVCPGLMRTGSPQRAIFKGDHRAEYAWFSIAGGLPLLSVSAERAARRIIRGIERGEGHIIISGAAKVAARLEGLFPDWFGRALGLVHRVLPSGTDTTAWPGFQSGSRWSPSLLTHFGDRAALKNHEDVQRDTA